MATTKHVKAVRGLLAAHEALTEALLQEARADGSGELYGIVGLLQVSGEAISEKCDEMENHIRSYEAVTAYDDLDPPRRSRKPWPSKDLS